VQWTERHCADDTAGAAKKSAKATHIREIRKLSLWCVTNTAGDNGTPAVTYAQVD